MAKKIKQYRLLIGLFVIYWVAVYSNSIIKVSGSDYVINLIQLVLLFIIFINLYFFIDLLLGKKMDVIVLRTLRAKKYKLYSFITETVKYFV